MYFRDLGSLFSSSFSVLLPVPLPGFLLFPPRPSATRCKSYTHSFWSSLKSHFFEAFASSVLFASWLLPALFLTFSFSLSARWPTSSFLHPGWKLLQGRSPLEMLGGGVAPSACPSSRLNQGVETPSPAPPSAPPRAGHFSFMVSFQYCFSLFFLT